MNAPSSILIIQTAYLGDAILATALAENLHARFPDAAIDILVRKGNELLYRTHPFIREVFCFDKKKNKLSSLLSLVSVFRKRKYDLLLNLHRFGSSGFITVLSGAKETRGFDKNPFSKFYTLSRPHHISPTLAIHEIERNHSLISDLVNAPVCKPRLYPDAEAEKKTAMLQQENKTKPHSYFCIAPASVWFTKQFPSEKWIELIHKLPAENPVFLLGGPADSQLCETIKNKTGKNIINLAGKLSFLETASLMAQAKQNFVNDSAPLHLASAMNAPVTAVFCSTVPEFGFGPLSTNSKVVQTKEKLACRPCGIHGHRACPQGHFDCAHKISLDELV